MRNGKKAKYVMGIDAGGFDGKTFSICVIRNEDPMVVEYLKSKRDESWFNKQVERLAKYYNIPPDWILKETN